MKVFVRIIQSGTQTPNLTGTANLVHVDQFDSDTNNDNTTCALIAPKGADMAVNQTQTAYTNNGNQYINYTITTTNNGPDNATGVQITDLLPDGVTWISDTGNSAYDHNTGIWNIGNFNMGDAPKILTITVQVNPTATGTIKNTASITAENEYDPIYANNDQTTIYTKSGTYTPTSNISIDNYPWWYNGDTKSQQYTYVVGNAPVNTVDVWNNGPDDATNVTIQYQIGNGLKYEGNSIDLGNVTFNSATNTLTWNIGYIANGEDALMKVFFRMIQSGTQTPNITTTATVLNQDEPTTCALTAPKGADIGTNTTQTTYTGTDGNQYITYTITTTNNGPDNATGVQITDLLPTGTTYTTSTPPTGTIYTNTNGIWNIGNITNQETKTLTITAQITQTTGTIKNTATITAENEYDPIYTNNSQTQTLSQP
jgi:uncharacterized repeat protein (TIGR01451 family)